MLLCTPFLFYLISEGSVQLSDCEHHQIDVAPISIHTDAGSPLLWLRYYLWRCIRPAANLSQLSKSETFTHRSMQRIGASFPHSKGSVNWAKEREEATEPGGERGVTLWKEKEVLWKGKKKGAKISRGEVRKMRWPTRRQWTKEEETHEKQRIGWWWRRNNENDDRISYMRYERPDEVKWKMMHCVETGNEQEIETKRRIYNGGSMRDPLCQIPLWY